MVNAQGFHINKISIASLLSTFYESSPKRLRINWEIIIIQKVNNN